MPIDLTPDFGDKILNFFMQREALQLRQEAQKLEKDKFGLQQQQVEFQQNQATQQAAGQAAGLQAGRGEEALAGVGQVMAALAGIPAAAPGGAALQQVGQAGQAAVGAQPTAEGTIQQLEDPFARAAASTALEGQRERAGVRSDRARRTATDERKAKEEIRWHNVIEDHQKRQLELEEKLGNARNRLLGTQTDTALLSASRQLTSMALDAGAAQLSEFRELAELYGSAELASLLVFGTATPPSRAEILSRNTRVIEGLSSEDPAAAAGALIAPSASDLGRRLGVHPDIIAQFETLQAQEGVEAVSNDEFFREVMGAIEASDLDRVAKEEQRSKARLWLIGVLRDPTLGADPGATGTPSSGRRQPPADLGEDIGKVLSGVANIAGVASQSQRAARR